MIFEGPFQLQGLTILWLLPLTYPISLTSIPYAGRHLISPVYTLTAAFVVQGDIQY